MSKQSRSIRVKLCLIAVITGLLGFGASAVPGPAFAESGNQGAQLSVKRTGLSSEISWQVHDASMTYHLFRDGKELEAGHGNGNLAESLPNFDSVRYVLTANRTMTTSEISEIVDADVRSEAQRNPSYYQTFDELSVSVAPYGTQNVAKASSSASSTLFRYQTFIPASTVPVTLLASIGCSAPGYSIGGNDYFLGDGRGYDPNPPLNLNSPSYRTRIDVSMDWISPGVSSNTLVGTTNLFHFNAGGGVVLLSRTPDKSSMAVTYSAFDKSSAHFTIDQNVRDPFCLSNGIYVHANVNIARSGAFSMFGSRIQVPSHEAYVKDSDSSSWTMIMSAKALDFQGCLTPGISGALGCNTSISYSGTR